MIRYQIRSLKHPKITSSTIDFIAYLSLLVLFLLHFLNLPSIFLSLLGIYFFLVFPYVMGQSICGIFFEQKFTEYFGKASKYFIEWIVGAVFVIVLFAFLQSMNWHFITREVSSILVFASISINILTYRLRQQNNFQIVLSKRLKYLLLSVCVSIAVVVFIKLFFLPIPNVGFNFDIPYTTYLTTIRFVDNGYVTLVWRLAEFILAGIPCSFLNLSPLYLLAAAPFALMILYSAGLYLLSYRLLNKPELAFLAVLIGIFINVGSIPVSIFLDNPAYAYRSDSILTSVFPFCLYLIVEIVTRQKFSRRSSFSLFFLIALITSLLYFFIDVSWIDVGSLELPVGYLGYVVFPLSYLSIFLVSIILCYFCKDRRLVFAVSVYSIVLLMFFLMHYSEALIFGLTISAFVLLYILSIKLKKVLSSFIIYTTVLLVGLQYCNIITKPLGLLVHNSALPSSYFITGFSLKWESLMDISHPYNALILLAFIALSAYLVLHEKDNAKLSLLALTWAILLFFFLPELFAYRSYQILAPLFAMTFTYAIGRISEKKIVLNRLTKWPKLK